MDPISELVESLAQSLRRSVAVDDADLHLVAHSTHFDDADPARLRSLANRRIDGPVREATLAAGFHRWTQPRRGRALGAYGHDYDRMSFPLRTREGLIGVMWVIIKDKSLSSAEMNQCLTISREIERLLAEQLAQANETDSAMEHILLGAIGDDQDSQTTAFENMRSLGLFDEARSLCVFVFRAVTGKSVEDADVRGTFRRAIRHSTEARSGTPALLAFKGAEAIALDSVRAGEGVDEKMLTANKVISEAARLDSSLRGRILVGVGTAFADAEGTPTSYRRAAAASRMAVASPDDVVAWEMRPLEALLDALLKTEAHASSVPEVVRGMDEKLTADVLRTVECFLDEAGSVARVSARLHLHRTTVYYRMRVFSKTTGLSLDSGRDRLLTHLWLMCRNHLDLE